jgi:GTP-binding protein
MFIDEVRIFVSGGKGGDGMAVMHREKFVPFGGPAGGTGGRGGHVQFVATRNHKTLQFFRGRSHFRAPEGGKGGKQNCRGRRGEDRTIEVPLGTLIYDDSSGDLLADLASEGETFLAAMGGRGGRGNKSLVTQAEPLPNWAEKGALGVERWVRLELKVMADVGLLGLPNAGKSTLLSVISNARPKIAAYPFTTLEPQLGVVSVGKGWEARHFVVADIPGLVRGAHKGTGLGDRFLRHVERTRLLLHLVDVSGSEGQDPLESYRAIRRELELFHPDLAEREELVVATKMDIPGAEEARDHLAKHLRREIPGISSVTHSGLEPVLRAVLERLDSLPEPGPLRFQPVPEVYRLEEEESPFHIVREDQDFWVVSGNKVDQLVATHSLDDAESLRHLDKLLREIGLYATLASKGAREGHTVRLGDFLFEYLSED